jgi:membrane-bound ClpP family serine protease
MGAFAIPLMIAGGKLRWIAALYSLGALLILAEIVSAQVILSQIGNVLIFCGGVVAAKRMMKDEG